ncbi:MAG TPA: hypothetical protein VGK24_14240 [Candidatus Angelobacter sp.]|jgi:hypothetical protein
MAKTANFEISIELKELKIHVKGDRELAPEIATEVANKISGMLQPAGLIEGQVETPNGHRTIDAPPSPAVRKRRRSAGKQGSTVNGTGAAINWSHDPAKWGTPLQEWKQWRKVAWLLHVVESEIGKDGMTTGELVDVFNGKFKAAGLLIKGNISRDLSAKSEYFGSLDDSWHLKQAGKDEAVRLVGEAKAGKVAA